MTDNELLDPLLPVDEDDDYSDHVCALCRTGGDMICCDGRCLRSFHPKCIGLREEDIPEDSPFVCSDCFSGVQRCFTCCHFGLENELVKCSVKFCGKFYHPECVKTLASSGEDYVCKLHSCDSCGDVVTNPMKRKLLWRCFRCPKAFDSKHRPRDVHVLAEGLFLCIRHTQEEEVWPEMSKKLAERLEKRNQQSADWAKKHSNDQITNGRNFSLLEKSDKFSQETIKRLTSAPRPGESEQQRQKRLKREEKERLDNEATIRASSIMPKKRQSTESDADGEDRRNGSDYDEDEPCFSPASVGGDDGHSDSISDNHRNLNSPHLSHLARHNEYRRQRKGLWNQSWNQYRDIQDEAMGIRRRDDSWRGQYYDQQNYYHSAFPSDTSQFSFTTSSRFPGTGAMDRTNTMLLSSASYPYPSYHDAPPAPSYDDPRGLPSSSPPSSTTFLMRTNALLSQLNNTDPQPNNFNNLPPEEGQNKRVKHDHSFDPYASSPSYSSALSSVPTTAPSSAVNGYSSHRSHDYTSPLGSNYSNGSRIDTTPVTNFPVSVSSSSSFPSTGSRVPLSSSTGILSRTEQLLAETSSSYTRPVAPLHPPAAASSRPTLSRTEQILAMTSNHSSSRSIPRSQPISSSAAPKTNHTSKAKENKMEATDLFAMLQASGLLPTK